MLSNYDSKSRDNKRKDWQIRLQSYFAHPKLLQKCQNTTVKLECNICDIYYRQGATISNM